jgi:hypothetical protein
MPHLDEDKPDPMLDLASQARIWTETDYGTARHEIAFNAFLKACEAQRPDLFGDGGPFEKRIEQATSDEIVDHALKLLGYPRERWPWKLGESVVLPDGYEAYPHFQITDRMTGTVIDLANRGYVFVKIDQHRPELDEWDNVLHVYEHTDGTTAGMVRDTGRPA